MQKKPPAYFKDLEKHPIISVRVSAELKRLLDKYRRKGSLSYPQAIKKLLTSKEELMKEKISLPCPVCGEPMFFSEDNEEDWNEIITILKRHTDWRHVTCPRKKK